MYEQYVRALTSEEALQVLREAPQPVRILAGGTDVLLQSKDGKIPKFNSLLDISNINELTGIKDTSAGLWIGSVTKLADIESSDLVASRIPVLIEGVREVGSPLTRNLATLGGNICNASPSADTVPALLTLDASVKLLSHRGEREVSLTAFFKGPGLSIIKSDEFLTAIIIPHQPANARGTYIKLKTRAVLDLAFVGISVFVVPGEEYMDVRIALGAVAPTPIRATQSEIILKKAKVLNFSLVRKAAQAAVEGISPISDVRASAEYRQEMVRNLIIRALAQVLDLEND
jgi:CO/xanthine dehydrogenase FAD-binding subunit